MDNLQVHKNAEAINVLRATGANIVFQPRYSPELNPIEMCWAFIKRWLRKSPTKCRKQLRRNIRHALQRVTTRMLDGWFDHCETVQLN